jgi:hypothetical protein
LWVVTPWSGRRYQSRHHGRLGLTVSGWVDGSMRMYAIGALSLETVT